MNGFGSGRLPTVAAKADNLRPGHRRSRTSMIESEPHLEAKLLCPGSQRLRARGARSPTSALAYRDPVKIAPEDLAAASVWPRRQTAFLLSVAIDRARPSFRRTTSRMVSIFSSRASTHWHAHLTANWQLEEEFGSARFRYRRNALERGTDVVRTGRRLLDPSGVVTAAYRAEHAAVRRASTRSGAFGQKRHPCRAVQFAYKRTSMDPIKMPRGGAIGGGPCLR
jgi:hypothetical protein